MNKQQEALATLIESFTMIIRSLHLELDTAQRVLNELASLHPHLPLLEMIEKARISPEVQFRIRDKFDIPLEAFRAERDRVGVGAAMQLMTQVLARVERSPLGIDPDRKKEN